MSDGDFIFPWRGLPLAPNLRGATIVTDESCPRGEIRFVHDGKIVGRIVDIGPKVFTAPDGTLVEDEVV